MLPTRSSLSEDNFPVTLRPRSDILRLVPDSCPDRHERMTFPASCHHNSQTRGDRLWHWAMGSEHCGPTHLSRQVGSWSKITYSLGLISSKTFSCLYFLLLGTEFSMKYHQRLMNRNVTNVDQKHDDNDRSDDTRWWWEYKYSPGMVTNQLI